MIKVPPTDQPPYYDKEQQTRALKSLHYLGIQIYSTFSFLISSFAGMALCDMFTLLCPAPGLIYMLTLGNHNQPLSGVVSCHAWIAFYEVSVVSPLEHFCV